MSFYYGDLTGQSGDQASPAPSANTPFDNGNGGTASPAYPVASPNSAMPSALGFGGTAAPSSPAALPFGSPALSGFNAESGFSGTPGSGSSDSGLGGLLGLLPLLSQLFGFGGSGGGNNGVFGSGVNGVGGPSSSPSSSDPFGGLFGGGGGGIGGNPFESIFGPQKNGSQAGALADTFDDEGNVLAGAEKGFSSGGAWGALAGGILGNITSTFGDVQQGRIGEGAGRWIGALLGLPLLGSFLGDTLAPAGLPKGVKPAGAVGALEGSNNPLEPLLGQFIQKYGINNGLDLSEPGGTAFNLGAYGDILQLLTGEKLPVTSNGMINLGNVPGAQKPVSLYGFEPLSKVQSQVPNATQLTPQQLQQISSQIAQMANTARIGHGQQTLQDANDLATKLKNAETY